MSLAMFLGTMVDEWFAVTKACLDLCYKRGKRKSMRKDKGTERMTLCTHDERSRFQSTRMMPPCGLA